MYPLQLALLVPFLRLGEKIFRVPPLALSGAQLSALIHSGFGHAASYLWTAAWHAVVAWCGVSPVFIVLAYVLLAAVLRRVWRARSGQPQKTQEGSAG